MTKMKNFKILAEFIKDVSSETKDIQTYLYVKDYISNYQLTIDITSIPSKNKLIEINTNLKFVDKEPKDKKSHFEIVYATFIKVDEEINEKEQIQKIILCDVQKAIQPNIEKAFTNLLIDSGYKNVEIKNIDFDKLYTERFG
jgi:preprotein translocase subunit SecB